MRQTGVKYLAGSPEVAIAESFQHGGSRPGTPLSLSEIEATSLYSFSPLRELKLLDTQRISVYLGTKLGDLTQARGQGNAEGYLPTQRLSHLCMRQGSDVDGLLYVSVAYGTPTGKSGCNMVLFEGREPQLILLDSTPVMKVMLPSNETALELLQGLKVLIV